MSIVRPLTIAFGFLTRLPVGARESDDADLGGAIAFFPIVGLALGIILTATAWLASSLPSGVGAVGLVALLAAATGGLHVDALADVFDALGGSHGDRERMLAIMRDSRIGAHGALALVLAVLAKVFSLGVLLPRGEVWPVLLFPAVARWAVVPLIVAFPYIREVGLGRGFKDQGSAAHVVWASAFMLCVLLWAGSRALLPSVAALVVALGFAVWMRRRIGGLTGDVYGAAIELAEVAFLAVAARGM